jgi:hypothetical protein
MIIVMSYTSSLNLMHNRPKIKFWYLQSTHQNYFKHFPPCSSGSSLSPSTTLCICSQIHEGRLKSSWTHLITPSQNFVEVQWWSLFWSTSLSKWCTSYNAPPTSQKHAADHWSLRNFLPQSSLFMVRKAQKLCGVRFGLYSGWSNGVPLMHFFQAKHRIQFRSLPMQFLGFSNHEKGAPRQEILKWSMACSMFSRSGWRVVRSALFAKGGTLKNRPSLHLHKVPTQSNKVSPQTL